MCRSVAIVESRLSGVLLTGREALQMYVARSHQPCHIARSHQPCLSVAADTTMADAMRLGLEVLMVGYLVYFVMTEV